MITQEMVRYSHTIGLFAYSGAGLYNPVDVALGRDDVLYIMNRAVEWRPGLSKRITMCSVAGDYLGEFSDLGTEDGKMMWTVALAIDKDGNVYMSDEGLHRISIFDKDGQYLTKWGVEGDGDGQFNGPAGMAFDGDDNLLVVDSLNNRIQRYTREGRFLAAWGGKGNGDGQFDMPWGIAVDRTGGVYVADWRNDRVQKFSADGRHLATWGVTGQGDGEFRRPSGVAVDDEGLVYVADWGNDRVQVLAPDGTFVTKLTGDATLSKWATSYFSTNEDEYEERLKADLENYVESQPEDEYFRREPARVEGSFWSPTSVRLDGEGRVYVADTGRHRVQIYQKIGSQSYDARFEVDGP